MNDLFLSRLCVDHCIQMSLMNKLLWHELPHPMLPDFKSQGLAAVSSESFISLVERGFNLQHCLGVQLPVGDFRHELMEVKDEKHQGGHTHQVQSPKHINLKAGHRDRMINLF